MAYNRVNPGDEKISKEMLYQAVESLCLHKYSASLYQKLSKQCEYHIFAMVDGIQEQVTDFKLQRNYMSYLNVINQFWKNHCEQMNTVRNIFLVLDRTYPQQQPNALSIWDLGLQLLRQRLEFHDDILQTLFISLLALIEQERHFQSIDIDLMRDVIRMLYALELYPLFEKIFLEDSVRFFQQLYSNLNCAESLQYLATVEKRIAQANEMVVNYMQPSTRSALLHVIDNYFLLPNLENCIASGLPLALAHQSGQEIKFADVKRMHSLVERVDQIPLLLKHWSDYIKETGGTYIHLNNAQSSKTADKEFDKTIVENLLTFYELMEAVLKNCFKSDDQFRGQLRSAFEVCVNKASNKIARLLVLHVDSKLRGDLRLCR